MDGMRLNTAQGGGVDLNLMPLATLERIEVVRGGHSALLGSDAVGGTIHLLTKNSLGPKKSSYGFNSTLGSFGTRIININGSQKWRALSLFFNYNHTQTDGNFNFITPDTRIILTRKNNDFKGNNIFTKTIWDISPLHKIQIQYQNFQTEKGSAGSVNVDPWTEERMITPKARSNSDRQFLSLQSENQLSQQLRFKEQVYYQIFDYQYKNPEGWTPVDDKHINKSFGLHVQGNLSLNRDILLSSGFEFRQDKLKSSQIQANDRFVQGLFTQAEIHKGLSLFSLKTLWTIIPAVRWDNYSDVRSNISPKVGFMVSTGQVYNVSIKANLGQSFRVPTFNDLYWPEDEWGNKGNADLHPETSTNIDVSFQFTHQSPSFWQADVTYFTSRIEDLIQWSPITNDLYSPWVPQNVGRAFISGIETNIRYDFPNRLFYLKVAHTHMHAKDDTPGSDTQGKILIYRPENKIDLFTGCNIGPVTANMNYRIISSRYISSDNLLILDSYHLFNANVSSTIEISSLSMNIKIQVMNMLNKTIYITDGYPLAGREFRLTLGVQY